METEYAIKETGSIYLTPEQILKESMGETILDGKEGASEKMDLGSWNNTEWAKWGDFGKFSNVN